MRDLVLEGATAEEVEALEKISSEPNFHLRLTTALRLRAKGWLDMVDGVYLLTSTGRTLLETRSIYH